MLTRDVNEKIHLRENTGGIPPASCPWYVLSGKGGGEEEEEVGTPVLVLTGRGYPCPVLAGKREGEVGTPVLVLSGGGYPCPKALLGYPSQFLSSVRTRVHLYWLESESDTAWNGCIVF